MESRNDILKKYEYFRKLETVDFLWEFIRRNEVYRKLYRRYISTDRQYFESMNLDERDRDRRFIAFRKKLGRFGLKYPLDPELQANDGYFRRHGLTAYFRCVDVLRIICWDDDEERSVYFGDIEPTGHMLAILINMATSQRKILSAVDGVIKVGKKELKAKLAAKKRIKRDSRSLIDIWHDCLIAYDLRNEDFTRSEIATLLFKEHKTELVNHTSECKYCRKIGRYVERAKKMINGKYKDFLPISG